MSLFRTVFVDPYRWMKANPRHMAVAAWIGGASIVGACAGGAAYEGNLGELVGASLAAFLMMRNGFNQLAGLKVNV